MRDEEIHTKKSGFNEYQILDLLERGESNPPVPELRRERGMRSAVFYNWCSEYGGMDASRMPG